MNVKIFFDESEKLSNPPMLMGGILINYNIYQKEEIQNILRLFQSISPYFLIGIIHIDFPSLRNYSIL